MRRQEEGEPVDSFITSLSYPLAKHCNYGDLHNEMIWDRIVVGLWDSNLSERLQTDTKLTLDKAITMTRRTEARVDNGGQASVDYYKRWYSIVLNAAENATKIQSV